jgi:hypothetical protein
LKKNLAPAAIALVLLLGSAFQSSNSVPGQLKEIQAQLSNLEAQVASIANKGTRQFYLTKTKTHKGNEALSACAMGYHMASLWEIHDPTNLRYNTDLGFTFDDSGSGPPTGSSQGWIRTGSTTGVSPFTGTANCNAWTSADATNFGTVISLTNAWTIPSTASFTTAVGPWIAGAASCGAVESVWCVQD